MPAANGLALDWDDEVEASPAARVVFAVYEGPRTSEMAAKQAWRVRAEAVLRGGSALALPQPGLHAMYRQHGYVVDAPTCDETCAEPWPHVFQRHRSRGTPRCRCYQAATAMDALACTAQAMASVQLFSVPQGQVATCDVRAPGCRRRIDGPTPPPAGGTGPGGTRGEGAPADSLLPSATRGGVRGLPASAAYGCAVCEFTACADCFHQLHQCPRCDGGACADAGHLCSPRCAKLLRGPLPLRGTDWARQEPERRVKDLQHGSAGPIAQLCSWTRKPTGLPQAHHARAYGAPHDAWDRTRRVWVDGVSPGRKRLTNVEFDRWLATQSQSGNTQRGASQGRGAANLPGDGRALAELWMLIRLLDWFEPGIVGIIRDFADAREATAAEVAADELAGLVVVSTVRSRVLALCYADASRPPGVRPQPTRLGWKARRGCQALGCGDTAVAARVGGCADCTARACTSKKLQVRLLMLAS